MKIKRILSLAVMLLTASFRPVWSEGNKSPRQPYPEIGFWVTETNPAEQATIVKYYANSIYLVSEKIESTRLDISKLSVRKYLNNQLKTELAKDSTVKTLPKLYEIN